MSFPCIGLALGGGGLRGAAHIGVLAVLEEEGIPVDMVTGTSAGSIVGGLWAAGLSPRQIERAVLDLKPGDVLDPVLDLPHLFWMGLKVILDILEVPTRWLPPAPAGLVRGEKLERWIRDVTGDLTMDRLQRELAVVATDLASGEEIIFGPPGIDTALAGRPGSLALTGVPLGSAVRASCSIPGVFTPYRFGHRDLVDGALKNNVPADVLRAWGADVVLAVDLEFAAQGETGIDNVVEVLLQSTDIMGQTITDLKLPRFADVTIRPGIHGVKLTDFHRIPYCLERGREAARAALARIRELLPPRVHL